MKGKIKVYVDNYDEPMLPENPKRGVYGFIDNVLHVYDGKKWIKVKGKVTYDAGYYYCPHVPDMKGGKICD